MTMAHPAQIKIPATYMRGGTSKGVFFRLQDLPAACQQPGNARDKLFLRVIGSPDPYAAHIDGMGGATSSTSKCVILSKSSVPDHDVDYLYGQVSIDKAFVDWSGNCGNLSTAAGAFAIHAGLVDPARHQVTGSRELVLQQDPAPGIKTKGARVVGVDQEVTLAVGQIQLKFSGQISRQP